ncbi:MAG: hypothetical protein VX899_01000 [Myxococcota bacterium]|nr:hypothetical protein [Myxococcota bacterium]
MRAHTLPSALFALVGLGLLSGCAESMSMTQGIGSTYETACSAKMTLKGEEYVAGCTPPQCTTGFIDAGVSQRVVAIEPGTKVVGMAERACVLDLSQVGLVQEGDGLEITPKGGEQATVEPPADAE